MSIVHEVTIGAHCGFRTLGLALITNKCLTQYDHTEEAVHEEVLRISELKAKEMQKLIADFLAVL
jgi:purine nucleoside phosphorylase